MMNCIVAIKNFVDCIKQHTTASQADKFKRYETASLLTSANHLRACCSQTVADLGEMLEKMFGEIYTL